MCSSFYIQVKVHLSWCASGAVNTNHNCPKYSPFTMLIILYASSFGNYSFKTGGRAEVAQQLKTESIFPENLDKSSSPVLS